MKYTIILISILSFLKSNENTFLIQKKAQKIELISFKTELPSKKKEYLEFEQNLKKPLKIVYKKGSVDVEYYRVVNECKKTTGKIIVKDKTIELLVIETGEGCKAIETKKIKFTIKNPENKKFNFVR